MILNSEFSNGRLHLVSSARRFEDYSEAVIASACPAGDDRGLRFAKGILAAAVLSLAFWLAVGTLAARLLR